MSGWRGIESAPKDGNIIGYSQDQGVGEYYWISSWYGNKSGAGWVPANLDEEYGWSSELTHWQPLPEPPK